MIPISEKIKSSSLEEAQSMIDELRLKKDFLKKEMEDLNTNLGYWLIIRDLFLTEKNNRNKFKP